MTVKSLLANITCCMTHSPNLISSKTSKVYFIFKNSDVVTFSWY
jgi:hypothetical protein